MKPYESNEYAPYKYFQEIEKPIARIFYQMSNRGISVSLGYLDTLRKDLESQKEKVVLELENEFGPIQRQFDLIDNSFRLRLNLNSPKQLLEALNEKGIYPTLKGKPSTDKRALAYHSSSRVVQSLLEYSQIDTLLSGFVLPYLERGQTVVHPFFNQCGTRTGRLSCSNPNLLQIPKHSENGKLVRKMFIPRSGMQLGDCDFGQIEPRVLAHLSKDPNMLDMFNSGLDFHDFTATRLGIDRHKAKVLNLSVGYKATFKSVSQQLKCNDREAQNEIDKWWNLFPTLRRWQDSLIYESKRSGFCTTLLGRRIKIEDLEHGNSWRREGAKRQLINNVTQGSAAEIMKLAMINVLRRFPQLGLLVQVYDELLFEDEDVDSFIENVVLDMEECIKLDVPLVVQASTGKSWGDLNEV